MFLLPRSGRQAGRQATPVAARQCPVQVATSKASFAAFLEPEPFLPKELRVFVPPATQASVVWKRGSRELIIGILPLAAFWAEVLE